MPVAGWKAKIKMRLGLQRYQDYNDGDSTWRYGWARYTDSNRQYGVEKDVYLYDDEETMDIFYFPTGGNFQYTGYSVYSNTLGKSYCTDGTQTGRTSFVYKTNYADTSGSPRQITKHILKATSKNNQNTTTYSGDLFDVSRGDPNGPKGNYNFANYSYSASYPPQEMLHDRLLHDFKTGNFNIVSDPDKLLKIRYTNAYGYVSAGLVIYDSVRETFVKDWAELNSLQSQIGDFSSGSSPCYFCVINKIDTTSRVVNDVSAPSVVISTVSRLNSSGATVPDETENDPANITVTAFDDISGVNKITIDGTDYTSSLTNIPATSTTLAGKSQQVSYSGVGTKVVKATATDVDGNISTEQSYTFSIVSPAAVTCNGWDEAIGVTNWPAEANTEFDVATSIAGTGSNQGWEYTIVTINNGQNFQDLSLVQLGQVVRDVFHEEPSMRGYKYYSLREHWPSILNPTANLNEIFMTGSDSLSYARVNMKGVLPASKGGRWVSIGYCASSEILSLADFTSGPVLATSTPTPPPPTTGGGSSTPISGGSGSAGVASNYHSRIVYINI